MIITTLLLPLGHIYNTVIRYAPMLAREQERLANLNHIYNCTDTEALWMLRMKRAPFSRLVQVFRSRGLLEDSIHTSVEEQVAMFLHVVGHNQRFRVIRNSFRRSIETISRYFKQVLYVVRELRGEMIVSPSGQTPTKIHTSPRWYPYFKVSNTICSSLLHMLGLYKVSTNTVFYCHFRIALGQ